MPPAMLAPVLGRPGPHRAGRRQGRPRHQRRRLVHAGEDRVVPGAQPEHPRGAQLGLRQAVPGVGMLSPPADRLHIRHVPRVVDQLQVRVGGRSRGGQGHAGQVPQPELMRQPHGQLHPHRRHRTLRPEVIVDQTLVPRHVHRAGHLPQPPRHRGLRCRTGQITACCLPWLISLAWSRSRPPAGSRGLDARCTAGEGGYTAR